MLSVYLHQHHRVDINNHLYAASPTLNRLVLKEMCRAGLERPASRALQKYLEPVPTFHLFLGSFKLIGTCFEMGTL